MMLDRLVGKGIDTWNAIRPAQGGSRRGELDVFEFSPPRLKSGGLSQRGFAWLGSTGRLRTLMAADIVVGGRHVIWLEIEPDGGERSSAFLAVVYDEMALIRAVTTAMSAVTVVRGLWGSEVFAVKNPFKRSATWRHDFDLASDKASASALQAICGLLKM